MYNISEMRIILYSMVALTFGLYLYFSYVRFYHIIGAMNLQSPYTTSSISLENPLGKGAATYVALGDSLSAGVGASNVEETFVYNYAENLSKTFQLVKVVNLAQPGGTTSEVLTSQLPTVFVEKPAFITLLIGTNDVHNKKSMKDFRETYSTILSDLVNKTDAKITVINIPYLGSRKVVRFPFTTILTWRTKKFNSVISDLVSRVKDKNRIKFIDLYTATYDQGRGTSDYYSSDFFHPSNLGYKLWSQIINAD
jgi:acyl-CoA thioesterase I